MRVLTSYPGVYINEYATPTFTIRANNTTVPIIGLTDWPTGPAQKINSFPDFISHADISDLDRYDMRAYFECGGAPCYVVSKNNFLSEAPKYNDINLLVTGRNNTLSSDIAALCEPGAGLFAILEQAPNEITDGNATNSLPETPFAAVYYPWLLAPWTNDWIPSSIVMAALYCVSDRTRGVWKAPANIALPAGYQPLYSVTDDLQGQYNSGKALNMIRKIGDCGVLVWGARTLEDSDDWRYISVRRLFNSAERDIQTALQTMVFEPNNQPTWEKVRSAINNYLYSLWRQSALTGATQQEAYFVNIGKGITMADDDIAQGKMIVDVGMAVTRPAEFIILQFTQNVVPA
jgi:hypothetical protein